MLRTLALVAVRQQADEAGHAQPLALARRDELVEHHLRAVGEVAELRLPQGQRVRLREGVAVLEAEHRLLRQHRVDDLVAGLVLADVVERGVALLVLLIDQHRVALREGAALHVLAGEAHAMALEQQRAEGERLGHRPVDALAGLHHLLAVVEEALDRAVDVEALRNRGERLADLLDGLDRIAGLAAARIVRILAHGLEARPAAVEPVGLVGLVVLARCRTRHRASSASSPSSPRPRPR